MINSLSGRGSSTSGVTSSSSLRNPRRPVRWLIGRPVARSCTSAASAASASPASSALRAMRNASASFGWRSLSGSGSGSSMSAGSGSGNPAATAVRSVATRVPSSAASSVSASRRGVALPAASRCCVASRKSAGPSASRSTAGRLEICSSLIIRPVVPPAQQRRVHHGMGRGRHQEFQEHQTYRIRCGDR